MVAGNSDLVTNSVHPGIWRIGLTGAISRESIQKRSLNRLAVPNLLVTGTYSALFFIFGTKAASGKSPEASAIVWPEIHMVFIFRA